MGKGFQNISQKECFMVHYKILESAEQAWNSANTLADSGNYGGATSYAIISLEEQIKGMVLLIDSHGFRFRQVKGMDALFENHTVRYIISYYIFVMAVFGEDLLRFIYRIRDYPDQMKELAQQYKTDKNFIEKKAGWYLSRKIIQLSQELEWFSKIDLFRQDGFYSDYDDTLKTPIIITRENFIETMERLIRVRFAASEIIRVLQRPTEEFKQELKKMQEQFHQDNVYNCVASGLEMVKKKNNDPFGFIRSWFDDLRNQE